MQWILVFGQMTVVDTCCDHTSWYYFTYSIFPRSQEPALPKQQISPKISTSFQRYRYSYRCHEQLHCRQNRDWKYRTLLRCRYSPLRRNAILDGASSSQFWANVKQYCFTLHYIGITIGATIAPKISHHFFFSNIDFSWLSIFVTAASVQRESLHWHATGDPQVTQL